MANKIPLAYADVELQLSTAITVGDTSFSLSSATDDDGNALPAGKYCFTIDNGSSNKEYLLGQLNGTDVTSVVSVSRQGVETSGAARAHRVGASAILSDFATIQRVADILRGQETLDASNPVSYDDEPTLSNREELATVAYVLDTVNGGTVDFDNQVITGVNAGETVAAGNLVYFKTSDQEWYLTDADTAATIEGVQLGIALGSGTDGAAISGGVQISGVYTTSGLTAGSTYYASNTAGAYATSAGTTAQIIGLALSTTRLLLIPRNPETVTSNQLDALAGNSGIPSSSNTFVTTDFISQTTTVEFTSSGTWTKDAGLKRIRVQAWGGGGSGAATTNANEVGGGGGGAYSENWFEADDLGSTETVTIGAGGVSRTTSSAGANGGTTTFGSLLTAYGGAAGTTGGGASGGDGGSYTGIGGADNAATQSDDATRTFHWDGGGGGGGNSSGVMTDPGAAHFGGGGGGSASGDTNAETSGGTSVFGGDGGDGQGASVTASGGAGSVPGGGGGGAASDGGTVASGAGGDGLVIVTEFYT